MNKININQHPCFNEEAKGKFGRVHIPVAPDCNIRCNYCNRKYDCVNESRPGVSSSLLSPEQSVLYIKKVLEKMPNTSVIGIAGPGDAFATPEITMETLRLIRQQFPELILCLASNGLNIGPYITDLAEFNVSHVTITINAVDPEIGSKIYSWIRDGKVIYRGKRAAEILLKRQLDAVEQLKKAGITVKINTIIVPGINEHHINQVAEKMAELGADLQNCMVMYKNAGTPFADLPELSSETVATLRSRAEGKIPQMKHCTRCRADAVGLLDEDKSAEFRSCLSDCSQKLMLNETRPFVAVATHEGMLVNQHLGEAFRVQIWGEKDNDYYYIEDRVTPEAGSGIRRWLDLADTLKDCRAVLVSGIGATPRHILEEHGIIPVEMQGLIQTGLETIYENKDIGMLKKRKSAGCSKGIACSGSGDGCG